MAGWFKAEKCPKDGALALAQGKSDFKCRKCGHIFKPKKGNKYNAQRSELDGATFESNDERRFLTSYLALRLKAKEIKRMEWKPRLEIEPGIFYRPECTYFDVLLGTMLAVDVKGGGTKGGRFPTVKTIWRNHMDYPLHVVEFDPRSGRWLTTEKVLPRNGKDSK